MTRSSFCTALAAAVCLVVVAGAGFLWYENAGPGYDSELKAIRGDLQAMPQVEIVELAGIDDDLLFLHELAHIRARIQIAGKGEMTFYDLSQDSARDTKHLQLVSVGPYRIRTRGEGHVGAYAAATGTPVRSEFGACCVDIGPEGEFAHLFPFELRNIQAAVAHYDEILEILGDCAEPPPRPRSFRDARGRDFYFWVVTQDVDESDDPLWSQPLSALRATAIRTDTTDPSPAAATDR